MITPLEIQNHKFSVKFKGYEQDEVKHFLYAVSEEFENLAEQNHQATRELAVLRARIKDMESRDKILKDTLITAQQIKADVIGQAQKEAELILREAQLKADTMFEEAKGNVTRIRQQISEVKRMRNDILAETEMMVSRFNHFVEAEREEANEDDKLHTFVSLKATDPVPHTHPLESSKTERGAKTTGKRSGRGSRITNDRAHGHS